VEWLVWGQTAAYSITAVVAMWLVLRKSGFGGWKFSQAVNMAILRQSIPYAILIFTSMIAYRADSVLLERIRPDGAHEAGIYAMGFRFYEAYNMIAYLFAVLLLPIFSRMLKHKQSVSSLIALAFKILFVGSWTVSLLCYFFGNQILSLFYDHDIEAAAPVFSWLMIACLAFSMQYIFGTLLTAGGYLRSLIIIAVMAMVLNITLNLIWIPSMGARGSAMANGICQVAVLLVQGYVVFKKLDIRPLPSLVTGTAFFMTGTTALGLWCTINQYTFAYSIVVVAGGALLIALITRMLDIRNFVRLLRESA
jgi:O-antigen/teichoic acid export membrane protein